MLESFRLLFVLPDFAWKKKETQAKTKFLAIFNSWNKNDKNKKSKNEKLFFGEIYLKF